MTTNLNAFNYDLFKIGKTEQSTNTKTSQKVGEKESKNIDIAGAAGWNNFQEPSMIDSFTRTTQTQDEKSVATTANSNPTQTKTTNPQKGMVFGTLGAEASQTQSVSNTNKFGTASGFGMLSLNSNSKTDETNTNESFNANFNTEEQSSTSQNEELEELANALDCEAKEDVVKDKLKQMSTKDLIKLDSKMLDIAKDLGLFTEKDVAQKTGVTERELTSYNTTKSDDKKIKFGTMTSGDMV